MQGSVKHCVPGLAAATGPIRLLAMVVAIALGLSVASAQDAPYSDAAAALSAAARLVDESGIDATDADTLRRIRAILDTIIEDFPASDIAVKILFQDVIDGLDVAALDRRLLALPAPEPARSAPTPPVPSPADQGSGDSATSGPGAGGASSNEPSPAIKATPQTPAPKASQPPPPTASFDASRFAPGLRDLARRLNQCYVSSPLESGDVGVTFIFSIAQNGEIDKSLKIKELAGPSGNARRIFQMASAAVMNCNPYPMRFANRSFQATFKGRGPTDLVDLGPTEPAWTPASQADQAVLKLDRKAVTDIQARLEAAGLDPNGVDGVMGKGTRAAVADWQLSQRIPATGYLDARQLAKLKQVTRNSFLRWQLDPANKARLDRASRPRAVSNRSSGRRWYRDRRGYYCRRLVIGTWCQPNRPRR